MSANASICPICENVIDRRGGVVCTTTGCGRSFHFSCLNMTSVPVNWVCAKCKRQQNSGDSDVDDLCDSLEKTHIVKSGVVIAYTRVSTPEQNAPEFGRFGAITQAYIVRDWAKKNGVCIRKYFRDVGSAYHVSKDLTLKETLMAMKRYRNAKGRKPKNSIKPADILGPAVDRFFRNAAYAKELLRLADAAGVKFISATETTKNGNCLTSHDPEFKDKIKQAIQESEKLGVRAKAAAARRRMTNRNRVGAARK